MRELPSLVKVFHGGRGSGKTLSMSVECLFYMFLNKKVFSNYPLGIGVKFEDGTIANYSAIPIDIEDLVSFRDDIRDGIVALDELNLWASNRGASALVNKLLNAWIQLIRKRNLSVFITCQSFQSLDKFLRWQTDLTVWCHDLCYKYRDLEPGVLISQRITDWSGIFTGREIWDTSHGDDYWNQVYENTRTRILHGRHWWGIYDSWSEVDIIKALTRFVLNRDVKTIGRDAVGDTYIEDGDARALAGDNSQLMDALIREYPRDTVISPQSLFKTMRDAGIRCSDTQLASLLYKHGVIEVEGGYKFERR